MKYLTVLVCVCLTHFSSQLLLDDSEGGDSSNENIETTTTVTTEIPTPVPTDMHEPSDQKREYKLQLTINEDKFNGTLQVDEGKHNYSDPIKVKYNSTALKISYCKCLNGIHHDLECKLSQKQEKNFEITFKNNDGKCDKLQLQLEYEGNYSRDGLHDFRALGKGIYYFANKPEIGNLMPYVVDNDQNLYETKIEIRAENYTFLSTDSFMSEHVEVLSTSLAFEEPFVIGKMKKFSHSIKIDFYGSEGENYDTTDAEELLRALTEYFENSLHSRRYRVAVQLLAPSYLPEEMNTDLYITQRDGNVHNLGKMSTSRKQSAQLMLFYRFSQQWTANKEKWLNLGLAAFLSNYYLDQVNGNTSFSVLDQFIVDQLQSRAFRYDGYNFSKPLNYFTKTSRPYEQYDPILYSKGASVMMALMEICGEKFDDLLGSYFNYVCPEGFEEFAERFRSCFDDAERGKNYFTQLNDKPGYPVIHIKSGKNKTEIEQETFGWTNNNQTDTWIVALKYKDASGSEEKTKWFNDTNGYVEDRDIIIVSSNGYFRVNYERKKWEEIIAGLIKNVTSVESGRVRARLINDLFSFARSTKQYHAETPDYESALSLKDYLKKENHYLPLKAAFEEFEFLDFALYGGEIHEKFREHVREIVEKLYEENGLTSASKQDPSHPLKIKAIGSWACKLEVEACIKDAQKVNRSEPSFLAGKVALNETHEVAACTLLRRNGTLWNSVFHELTAGDVFAKIIYINLLGCSNESKNLKKLFDFGMNSSYFSDCVSAIQAGGPENIAVLLEEIEKNIEEIENRMGLGEIENVIKSFYGKLNDKNAEKLKTISDKIKSPNEVKSEVKTVLEEIRTWKNTKTKLIIDCLNGVAQATPRIALALFLPTVLSLTNNIFRF